MNKKPNIRFKGFSDDWEQRKLGELCERVTRKNKNVESDLPLTIASQYGLIDQRNFFNKVVAAKDMSNYYLLKKGEFAYNKSYSKGFDYGSVKRLNVYEQGCLSTLYICFGIKSDDVESDYLECFFDTLKWYSDITMICAEGARNHGLLNVDTKAFFDEVTITMPSHKEEQRKISVYLNNLDHLITLHQRKCDKLKELKKHMLKKMFPKNNEKFPEYRFDGFTDPWEQRKLGEVATFINGRAYSQNELLDEGKYKVLRVGNFYTNDSWYYSDLELPDKFYAQEGDLLYTWSATFGPHIWHGNKVIYHYHIWKVELSDKLDKTFTLQLLEEDKANILANKNGSTMVHITKEGMEQKQISIPSSVQEQAQIGAYFEQLDHLITLHQRKVDNLKIFKKFMLKKMFV
ncbi:restriction endonuclease subunit S [Eshraghiella crossota]|uniref:restriction endonuclease subunit S n=1 Tax=Eshraghiella crossota TaxID=45851 RepID=UPI003F7ED73E